VSGRRVTVFLPLSRVDRVEATCLQVMSLDCSGLDVDVVVVVDNPDIEVHSFSSILGSRLSAYCFSGLGAVDSGTDMVVRRQRICDVFGLGTELVGASELVFVLEDDTDIGQDFLLRLVDLYDKTPDAGVVSGVECGRWMYRIIGAWDVDDPVDPSKIESVVFRDIDEIQYVCATGFYCCVVRADLFKAGVFRHDLLGPDFYFGLDLAAQGFKNVVDWSLRCGHVTETICLSPEMSDSVVRFDLVDGYWVRNQEEDPRDRCRRLQRFALR
jgi:hypothetical protein